MDLWVGERDWDERSIMMIAQPWANVSIMLTLWREHASHKTCHQPIRIDKEELPARETIRSDVSCNTKTAVTLYIRPPLYALLGAQVSSREGKRERESELFARDGSQAFCWGFLPYILILKYMRCNYLRNYEAKSYIWCIPFCPCL
jgi:hypothetical protein